jgi:hypothetical protein
MGKIKMTNWKADLDALFQQAMAIAKSIRVEAATPRAIIEPPVPRAIIEPEPYRMPPVNQNNSERYEIQHRVSNFRAHQERVAREREEFAASLLKRMLDRTPPPPADQDG